MSSKLIVVEVENGGVVQVRTNIDLENVVVLIKENHQEGITYERLEEEYIQETNVRDVEEFENLT